MSKWESLCTVMFDEDYIDIVEKYDLIENYVSPLALINFIFLQRFSEELDCSLSRYKCCYHLSILDEERNPTACFLFPTLKDLYNYLLKKQREKLKKKKQKVKLVPVKSGKKTRKRIKNEVFCPHIKEESKKK